MDSGGLPGTLLPERFKAGEQLSTNTAGADEEGLIKVSVGKLFGGDDSGI